MAQPEIEEAHNLEGARILCKEVTGAYCGAVRDVLAAQAVATKHAQEPWTVVWVLLDDYKVPFIPIILRTSLQGYLTHKKRTPLGPYRRPMPKVLGGS